MKKLPHGILITCEGVDGSGKSTLVEHIDTYLKNNGYECIATKEPGGSWIGKGIRNWVHASEYPLDLQAECFLFAADRAQHMSEVVRPALDHKRVVVSDRCADSLLAYQGYGRGLNVDMLKKINEWAMREIKPHLTLYIRVDAHVAYQRIIQRGKELTSFEKEKISFFERVITGYEAIFAHASHIKIIDGKQPQDTVIAQGIRYVQEYLDGLA